MNVESFVGFNPNSMDDRKMLHNLLGEFLDKYLRQELAHGRPGSPMAFFKVFGHLDKH